MNEKQALLNLIQGIEIAQKQGAYSLQDAVVLHQSIEVIKNRIKELGEKE